jgi:hypothetical protein
VRRGRGPARRLEPRGTPRAAQQVLEAAGGLRPAERVALQHVTAHAGQELDLLSVSTPSATTSRASAEAIATIASTIAWSASSVQMRAMKD